MPDWKPEILQRLAPLELPALREAFIVEELSTYLDDCYSEALAKGAAPDEAWRHALGELGNSEGLTRELQRMTQEAESKPIVPGASQTPDLLADLWHDLRYGARGIWAWPTPGWAIVTKRSNVSTKRSKPVTRA